MIETPKGLRLHIGLYGRRNVGKSSLLNALVGQQVSIVSQHPGTTTDPVEKVQELAPIGPVVFIDTAGIDDEDSLGRLRKERSLQALDRTDIALLVVEGHVWGDYEEQLVALFAERKIPFAVVFNKTDLAMPSAATVAGLHKAGTRTVYVSALQSQGIEAIKIALAELAPEDRFAQPRLLGDLLAAGDLVVLVVPIDLGAPKGRLILPQVQAIRDILDSNASCLVVKESEYAGILNGQTRRPKLVVCDSQVVRTIAQQTPADIKLTTFSILMARFKGDLDKFARGVAAIETLRPHDQVLIAESCSHHPLADDIGRVKIPGWLRQYASKDLHIDNLAGREFPEDLSLYKLIIHCGGCTANRKQMLTRLYRAEQQQVAMTNYGLAISYMQGVLPRVLDPFPTARAAYLAAVQG
ncbi:MAG: [FeFe] hydrogenase H-cluster maturation GTPase HydF [Desulfobulbaceae bacterium]|nr:[FeFe] hydrogenase H-cluster maturation GTPase HydF [Desulfobulbaceae bacterium]